MMACATGALFLSLGLMGIGCGAEEAINDFNSKNTCEDYCAKNFECNSVAPTTDETDVCVSDCRASMENDCGNENQDAANDQINECVDKGCAEFWACMVFDAAPECYGFVSE